MLNIPKCEHFTLLVCPLRFLVISAMRRLGNVQHTCFAFELFAMNAIPARRVTHLDTFTCQTVTPADRVTLPGRPGGSPHLSCKGDQNKIRNWTGGLPHLLGVPHLRENRPLIVMYYKILKTIVCIRIYIYIYALLVSSIILIGEE